MKTQKLLAASLAVLLSASAFAQTADEIIDKHITARGGNDKLKSIQSLVTESSMSVQGMDIPMTMTIVSGKGFRQEVSVMGNSMITVINGDNTGWSIRPAMMQGTGEPEDLPAEALKGSSSQIDPNGSLFNYKEKGATVTLVGTEKVNGKDAHHLLVTPKEGSPEDNWIDASTYMLVKRKATSKAMGQEVTQELVFSDYKDVDGVKIAYTTETESPMGGPMTIVTNKVVINGKVDESIFKKPAK